MFSAASAAPTRTSFLEGVAMSKDKKDKKDKKDSGSKKGTLKDLYKIVDAMQEQIDDLEDHVDYLESELEEEQNDRGMQLIATQEAVARVLHLLFSNERSREVMAQRLSALIADDHDYEKEREDIYAEYFGDENMIVMNDDELAEMDDRILAVDHDESLDQIELYILDGALNGVPAEDDAEPFEQQADTSETPADDQPFKVHVVDQDER